MMCCDCVGGLGWCAVTALTARAGVLCQAELTRKSRQVTLLASQLNVSEARAQQLEGSHAALQQRLGQQEQQLWEVRGQVEEQGLQLEEARGQGELLQPTVAEGHERWQLEELEAARSDRGGAGWGRGRHRRGVGLGGVRGGACGVWGGVGQGRAWGGVGRR